MIESVINDALPGLILVTVTGFLIAVLLTLAARKFQPESDAVIEQINKLLPQTQCAQCGYPGCRPYAMAISTGEPINRCPPGGEQTIRDLANLLGRDPIPLDETCGTKDLPKVAKIRELECIGCTLCIQACPVDAILGAAQQMHSVIESECTGCDLCVDPCPVDCIDMVLIDEPPERTAAALQSGDSRKLAASRVTQDAAACIRCGECEAQCPKQLAPQELLWQKESSPAMLLLKLDDCIECMICDRVCPSQIPLTQTFITTKQRITRELQETAKAARAEARYGFRETRLDAAKTRLKTRASTGDRASLLAQLKRNLQ